MYLQVQYFPTTPVTPMEAVFKAFLAFKCLTHVAFDWLEAATKALCRGGCFAYLTSKYVLTATIDF